MKNKTQGRQPRKSVSSTTTTTIKSIQKRGNGRRSRQNERAEKALRESEEKYRNLFEYAKDAILLADMETGLILDVNTAGCKLLGLPKRKIIGMHQSEIHPPELAEKYKKVFQDHIEKGIVTDEYMVVQRADGKQISVDISTSLIKLGNKPIIQGTFRDVSERLRMEKALRESEEKISKAFRAIPEAVSIATLKDGVFLEVNDSFLTLNRYSRDEIIGHNAKELNIWVNPDDRYRIKQLLEKKGHFENEEFILRRKSGEVRTVLLSADIITYEGKSCILTIGVDITERKRAEEALKESEEKFHNIVERSNDGITFIQNGLVQYGNSKMLEMTGYSEKEALGKPFINFIAPEHKEKIIDFYKKRLAGKKAPDRYELNMLGKNGKRIYTEISASVINVKQTKLDIAIVRDITERKQMEQALIDEATRRRILVEQSSDGIVVIDENGKVYDANQKFADMLGYSLEEVRKLEISDWSFSSPREQVLDMLRTVDEKGDHFETQHRRKDGTIYDVEISTNGAMFAGQKLVFCVCRDITERKRMEQALRESEEKFSKAFHASPQQIIITRERDDVTLEVNDTYTKVTGYTREETIGKTSEELGVWPESADMQRLQQTLKEHGRIENEEYEFITKSGDKIISLLSIEPITIGGEKCWISVSTDITRHKQVERELKDSEERISKAFRAIPEAIAIVTVDEETFVEMNDSFPSLTGYSREELIGHVSKELNLWVDPSDHDRIKQSMYEKGHFENEEFVLKRKSGDTRTLLMSGDVINFGGQPCILVVANDITERKRIEQALKESEEKFSTAFRAIPEAVSIVRMKDGVFIDVNDSFCTNIGYKYEEIVGHNENEIITWVDPNQREKIYKLMFQQGQIKNIECEFRTKSGEIRTIQMSADVINISGEPCVLNINSDITERKVIEQALKESEEKFSKVFRGSPELIAVSRRDNNTYIDVNDSFIKTTGYTRKELIGHSVYEINMFANPEDQKEVAQIIEENGNMKNREYSFRMKSGEIRHWLCSVDMVNIGGIPCSIASATDVTEHKIIEQALKESEEKFSKAFHAIPETISISTTKDERFIDVNESFLKLHGLTREETIGHTAKELKLINPNDERYKMEELLKENKRFKNLEIEFKTKSEEILTLLFSADTIEISGEPCLLIIGNDITKRKQAEKELHQALTDLEQSSALLKATNKELESFSYSVSHDLRSPLRSIDGFSQALLEDYSANLDEKGQDYLNRLRNASQKMGELIDGLLKLSRLTRSEMHYEKVDLSSLASEIAARLQETHAKRDAKFIIGNNLTANGDPQMLRVLLENLLGNAWKFTKNTPQARIEFGSTTENGTKTFYIKDNGAGFDMAFKDKLFGAFQRLHDTAEYPGTGIGLATVQRIINRHGGNIRAEGATGKGASFYFTLN